MFRLTAEPTIKKESIQVGCKGCNQLPRFQKEQIAGMKSWRLAMNNEIIPERLVYF